MASITLGVASTFPAGTTVGAYPASNWTGVGADSPSGAPPGSATTTAVVSSTGDVTFTGLADNTRYLAAADVSGTWKYVKFSTLGAFADIKRAFANVAASTTDAAIVAAVAGKKIRVKAVAAVTGGTATTLTFNSKPAGAGTAISPLLANGSNGGEVLPFMDHGWFETVAGEGLSATTGAGSATGVLVLYVEA